MTEIEKLEMLKTLSGETNQSILLTYLQLAGNKVLRRAYPFDSAKREVPEQYAVIQVEIAAYLLNKRGAEGETVHKENGIDRTYESADVPESLLRQILPSPAVFPVG